uniref:Uncharacterized protein n=1 Tax=Lygus hesperus TaxID=30085 RepID=A0A146MDC3_LYGHE
MNNLQIYPSYQISVCNTEPNSTLSNTTTNRGRGGGAMDSNTNEPSLVTQTQSSVTSAAFVAPNAPPQSYGVPVPNSPPVPTSVPTAALASQYQYYGADYNQQQLSNAASSQNVYSGDGQYQGQYDQQQYGSQQYDQYNQQYYDPQQQQQYYDQQRQQYYDPQQQQYYDPQQQQQYYDQQYDPQQYNQQQYNQQYNAQQPYNPNSNRQ